MNAENGAAPNISSSSASCKSNMCAKQDTAHPPTRQQAAQNPARIGSRRPVYPLKTSTVVYPGTKISVNLFPNIEGQPTCATSNSRKQASVNLL
jgi:hypothetical protein